MKSFKYYVRSGYNKFLNLFRKKKYLIVEFDVDPFVFAFLKQEAKRRKVSLDELVADILQTYINI